MISKRLITIGIAYIFGVVCATFFQSGQGALPYIFYALLAIGTAVSAWTIAREFKWKENHILLNLAPLFIAAFSAGNLITNNVLRSDNPGVLFFKNLPDKTPVEMIGTISSEPEARSETRLDLRLKLTKTRKAGDKDWLSLERPIDIRLSVNWPYEPEKQSVCAKIADSDAYGYEIETRGVFEKTEGTKNPGGFDYESFLLSEGYMAAAKIFDRNSKNDFMKIIAEKRGNPLVEAALIAKKSFLKTLKRTVPPPESFFLSGVTFGTRFSIKKQEYNGRLIEDAFRYSGVGHVLAVSGLHVSVVSLLLYSLFKMTRIPPKHFAPVLITLLFCFAFLTGARPSSLRATIMNSLVLVMFVYGGGGLTQSAYAGLAFSSFLILLRKPMALYSAGFLLSFGAVLSLVMLTNPFDKIIRNLRGGRLFGAIIWFASCIWMISVHWNLFLRWEMLILFGILLYALVSAGELLNRYFPVLLKINPDKLPQSIRFFLSAQLGIQFGMMIPLSSFFFGQMPVAGMFVNLLAIPLIGVVVQLGLLLGIFGVIPVVGQYIALVLGAADYIVSKFFIYVADLGPRLLPFPVTPLPTPLWLLKYYLALVVFLIAGIYFKKIQTAVYKLHSRSPFVVSKLAPAVILCAFAIFAYFRAKTPVLPGLSFSVLASSGTPVICINSADHRTGAVVFNGGSSFFAKSSLKNFILKNGDTTIDAFVVGGHSPEFGSSAIAGIGKLFEIKKVAYPNFHEEVKSEIPPDFDSMEEFFGAIGENKILKSAFQGKSWAKKYYDDYKGMRKLWGSDWTFFSSPFKADLSDNIKIEYLNAVYRAYPLAFKLFIGDKVFLVLPDPASAKKIKPEELKCDILILGSPTRNNYKYYVKPLSGILSAASPKTVILCVEDNFTTPQVDSTVEKISSLCAEKSERFFRTDQSGALTFPVSDGKIGEPKQYIHKLFKNRGT